MQSLTPVEMLNELNARLHNEPGPDRMLMFLNATEQWLGSLRDDFRFLIKLDASITTADGTATYDLASDFGWMIKNTVRITTSGYEAILYPRSLEWLYEQDAQPNDEATPMYYILCGPNGTNGVELIRFWNVPDTIYTVLYNYRCTLGNLSTVSNTPSRIPDHDLLMDVAEIRGRVDAEEDSETTWMEQVKQILGGRLEAFLLSQGYRPDTDTRVRRDSRITMSAFGG